MSDFNANIVKTVLPKDITPVQPSSASKFILSRRQKRFLPDQQTTYDPDGNNTIRFTMNDSVSFWKPKSHYLKFKVTITGADAQKYIDVPGAAAFFQRVSLRTASGSRIEERDYYGLYESIKSHVMDSPECVEYMRHMEGDSMKGNEFMLKPYGYLEGVEDLGETVASTAANQINASGNVTLSKGEVLIVAGYVYYVTADVAAATAIPVSPDPVPQNAAIVGKSISAGLLPENIEPQRKKIANAGTAIELIHKIDLGMLKGDWFLPLPMIKNLQIEIDLSKAEFALVSPGDLDVSYTISQPELIAELVEFDRSVLDQYKELFNGGGIAYPFSTYRYNNRSLTGPGDEVQVYANVRSAHSVINVFTDDKIITTSGAKPAESLSTFKKYDMKQFEVLSGSERYPFYGPMKADDVYATDIYKQNRKAFMVDVDEKEMSVCGRIHPSDLTSSTSNKFIWGVLLSREDGDDYAGIDLTNENIQIKYTLNSNPGNHYLHSFLMHSATLNISKDGVILRS